MMSGNGDLALMLRARLELRDVCVPDQLRTWMPRTVVSPYGFARRFPFEEQATPLVWLTPTIRVPAETFRIQ